jgi:CheY-like chemotaxis protein
MNWTTRSILVVDREDEGLETLRKAMQSTDCVLFHARTGAEALAVLSRLNFPVDLVVLDLDLCDDDGLVISLLTTFGRRKSTKLIVKASRQDKSFLERVKYFGVDAILFKPTSEEQLIKTVQERLTGTRNGSASASAGIAA